MRLCLAAAALLLVAATAAHATDPSGAGTAPSAAAPSYDWSGFYAGIHGGYGWSADSGAASSSETLGSDAESGGPLGGVQAGVNWQSGPFVFGVEGDISGVSGFSPFDAPPAMPGGPTGRN